MTDSEPSIPDTIMPLLKAAYRRSRYRGTKSELTWDEVLEVYREQKGRCALTGIEFDDRRYESAMVKRPYAPSIDQIAPGEGYWIGNVQIVCTAANFAKGQWGDDVLRNIAHGVVDTERRMERDWYRRMKIRLSWAERKLASLEGRELTRQKQLVAGIKAAITKGPARLSRAGEKARRGRSMLAGNANS